MTGSVGGRLRRVVVKGGPWGKPGAARRTRRKPDEGEQCSEGPGLGRIHSGLKIEYAKKTADPRDVNEKVNAVRGSLGK